MVDPTQVREQITKQRKELAEARKRAESIRLKRETQAELRKRDLAGKIAREKAERKVEKERTKQVGVVAQEQKTFEKEAAETEKSLREFEAQQKRAKQYETALKVYTGQIVAPRGFKEIPLEIRQKAQAESFELERTAQAKEDFAYKEAVKKITGLDPIITRDAKTGKIILRGVDDPVAKMSVKIESLPRQKLEALARKGLINIEEYKVKEPVWKGGFIGSKLQKALEKPKEITMKESIIKQSELPSLRKQSNILLPSEGQEAEKEQKPEKQRITTTGDAVIDIPETSPFKKGETIVLTKEGRLRRTFPFGLEPSPFTSAFFKVVEEDGDKKLVQTKTPKTVVGVLGEAFGFLQTKIVQPTVEAIFPESWAKLKVEDVPVVRSILPTTQAETKEFVGQVGLTSFLGIAFDTGAASRTEAKVNIRGKKKSLGDIFAELFAETEKAAAKGKREELRKIIQKIIKDAAKTGDQKKVERAVNVVSALQENLIQKGLISGINRPAITPANYQTQAPSLILSIETVGRVPLGGLKAAGLLTGSVTGLQFGKPTKSPLESGLGRGEVPFEEKTRIKVLTRMLTPQKVKTSTKEKPKQDLGLSQFIGQKVDTSQKQIPRTRTQTRTLLKTVQVAKQLQKQKARQILQQIKRFKKPSGVPLLLRFGDKKKALKREFQRDGGFEAFGRRYGKDISLGLFTTKRRAAKKLKQFLKGGLGASGFLEEKGEPVPIGELKFSFGEEFRPSKKDPFRVVQKRSFRLGTGGEIFEIQRAKRQKTKKVKWLS